jgi:hypothetical protein
MNPSNQRENESPADKRFESLLDEHAVADWYGISVATLRRWRWLGSGPVFLKIGASVRYRRADLEAYLQSRANYGDAQ